MKKENSNGTMLTRQMKISINTKNTVQIITFNSPIYLRMYVISNERDGILRASVTAPSPLPLSNK